ncbi:sigma-70 family RNA polymerase sigma factor [Streptomyces sp. NPDC007164]|uniref:sigma-70 family RNA polymerase sigma factor n=1 Tax=Streptomyces sp. NPDC007164 TaxID=3156918 RepID=UPI0033D65892
MSTIHLTPHQVMAAKAGDPDAVNVVLRELEGLLLSLAWRVDRANAEDLSQVGREAVWTALTRFRGTTVGEFINYAHRTATGAMSDARKEAQRQGVSRAVAADFERALRLADGDPYLAQILATTPEVMGVRRMTPETAYAARMSYEGPVSLDLPVEGSGSLAEALPGNSPADDSEARTTATEARTSFALRRLGRQHRTVLELTHGIGESGTHSDAEISALLGISPERVRSVRARARRRFAELYRQWGGMAA